MRNQVFPQYRRLIGGSSSYRIDSADRFVELQRIGSRWVRHEVHAVAYPEKVRVAEMLDLAEGVYETISASEFRELEARLAGSGH